jgi:hypothetical protein
MRTLACTLSVLFLFLSSASADDLHTWTSADGRTLEASFVSTADGKVRVRRSNGQSFDLPLSGLSDKDQQWVQRLLADQARARGLEEGKFAERATAGEWIKVPASEHGILFQIYGTSNLKRLKEPFPLFVHLHGAGARANEVEVGKVEIAAQRLAREEQYDETPCLIIVPTCPPDTYWGDHVPKLEALIDELVAALPIDRQRIYLSGYSMGARGIGSLLKSRPKFYAAAMFADGDASHDWVENVDTALWLWFSGERDMKKAEAVAKAFTAAGKTAHYEGFEEFTHNQIHWKLAHDEEVFPWMFEQRLGESAAGEEK